MPSLALTGPTGAHVSVIQYGNTNKLEINWMDEQSKTHLLGLVEGILSRPSTGTRPALGTVHRKLMHACNIEDKRRTQAHCSAH